MHVHHVVQNHVFSSLSVMHVFHFRAGLDTQQPPQRQVRANQASGGGVSVRGASSTSSQQNQPTTPSLSNKNQKPPVLDRPAFVLHGGPSIKQIAVLNDKRHILTKDTDGDVAMYDVLKAGKVKEFGKVDFDEEVKRRYEVRKNLTFLLFSKFNF